MTAAADLPDWIRNVGGTSKVEFNGAVPGGFNPVVNVAQYGSVQVVLFNADNVSQLAIAYQFLDPNSGRIVDAGLLSAEANHSIVTDGFPAWVIPVAASQLILINNTGGNVSAVVTGYPAKSPKLMGNDYYPARTFQGTIPANSPNGTRVQLTGQDGNAPVPALRDCSSYNGAMAALILAGGNISGQVQFRYRNDTAATVDTGIFSNPTTLVQQLNIGHPFAYVTWWFVCTAVSPAVNVAVKVVLVPAEVDG